ncbi:protein of unknown function [Pararobbsia alpina]
MRKASLVKRNKKPPVAKERDHPDSSLESFVDLRPAPAGALGTIEPNLLKGSNPAAIVF